MDDTLEIKVQARRAAKYRDRPLAVTLSIVPLYYREAVLASFLSLSRFFFPRPSGDAMSDENGDSGFIARR